MLPRRGAVVAGGAPDELDEPVEGLLDAPLDQVEVGDQGLGLDVVGSASAAAAPRPRRHPGCAAAPWPSPARRRPRRRRGWRRRASGTPRRRRRCRCGPARPRPRRSGGRRRLAVALVGAGAADRGWCRPVTPCAVSCCPELVNSALSSSCDRTPGAAASPAGRRGAPAAAGSLDLHGLGDLRGGVDVDQPGQEPAVVLLGGAATSWAKVALSGDGPGSGRPADRRGHRRSTTCWIRLGDLHA